MLSAQDGPKSLPEWLELDYPRRPGRLRRNRRWRLLLAAGGLVPAVLLAFSVWPARNRTVFAAGPVSTAHAMFDHDCGQCHTQPFATARRLWPGNAGLATVTDAACTRCHDGPPHHPQQAFERHCTACHREHHGRTELARVVDGQCTACHADLKLKDGTPPRFLNVHAFPDDHPEFRLFRTGPRDPGTVRFNHAAHLDPEGVLTWAPDQPPPGEGSRKRAAPRKQLGCADCHQPDGTGRSFRPVNYENHCATCHPLGVSVRADADAAGLREAIEQFQKTPAPHRVPGTVRAELRERYLRFVQEHPSARAGRPAPAPEHPIPGRRRPAPVRDAEQTWADAQVREAERVLYGERGDCRYCHQEAVPPGQRPDGLPEYRPSNVPARWLAHGSFNHESHRLLDCQACHAAQNSRLASDVLLPKVESCKLCHRPSGGARSDCVECHGYHDPGQKAAFRGTIRLDELLKGALPR